MNKVITIDFKQKLQKINLKEIKKVKEIKSKSYLLQLITKRMSSHLPLM